ncbi:hypothetical protein EGJ09_25890 [Pseudomonas sp. p106]|nr:hypothetical protein EGJ09_25890 [Pseudomonas sp. p106]
MGSCRTLCRRFGASICLCPRAPRCKNDRGFAESVNARHDRVWHAVRGCETVSITTLCRPYMNIWSGAYRAGSG